MADFTVLHINGGTHVVAESGVSQTVVVGLKGLSLSLSFLGQQVEAGIPGGDPLDFEGFPLVVSEFDFVLDGLIAKLGVDAVVERLEGGNFRLDVVGKEFLTRRFGRLELDFEGFPLVVGEFGVLDSVLIDRAKRVTEALIECGPCFVIFEHHGCVVEFGAGRLRHLDRGLAAVCRAVLSAGNGADPDHRSGQGHGAEERPGEHAGRPAARRFAGVVGGFGVVGPERHGRHFLLGVVGDDRNRARVCLRRV